MDTLIFEIKWTRGLISTLCLSLAILFYGTETTQIGQKSVQINPLAVSSKDTEEEVNT